MEVIKTVRGFGVLVHSIYPGCTKKIVIEKKRLLQESSAVGDYENALTNPGSSYLWVGNEHHLSREEVEELVYCLNYWLKKKRLPMKEDR